MSDEDKISDSERREYFRIDDHVLLSAKVVTPSEEAEFFADLEHPAPSAFGLASQLISMKQENLVLRRRAQSEHSALTKYIHAVEQQLDMMVQVMMINEITDPEFSKRRKVTLGGGGVNWISDTPIEEGTLLDIRLVLFPGHLGLRTAGRVVRFQPHGDQYEIGVEFFMLKETENEMLVQHVLAKQALQLRKQREAKWDAEQ